MKSKTTALYVRVSTDNQLTGLESQIRALKNYCQSKGITHYKVYEEFGISGAKATRPQLDKMILDCEAGIIDSVVVYSFSRFARSSKHLILALELFDKLKIRFVSITESVDSYSEVNRLMREFRQITDSMNVAFILLHHSSKASPKSALGSQAFEGSVDNIISIFDCNGHYFYETNGRFDNIEKTEIILDPENYHLSTDEMSGLSDEEKVLKVVEENDGLSGSAAAKLIKKNKASTLELVKNLESQKKLVLVDGKYKVSGKG